MDDFPERKRIEGQWCKRWKSPYPDWPGFVYVPEVISPAQFVEWWKIQNEPNDTLPGEILVYLSRKHLVVQWHIEGLQPQWVTDWEKYPSMEIPNFVVSATKESVARALTFPKLGGSSGSGASGEPDNENERAETGEK